MLIQNDQEHFIRLWLANQSSVVNYVHSLVRDRSAAEDLLQEIALHTFRRFEEYDVSRPFVAWALGVARFKVLSFQRDASRCRLVFDEESMEKFTETWIEQSTGQSERAAALETCIDKLADHSRSLLQLRYVGDLTSDQIALKIGSKGTAVRVALQRIRNQLRECVERKIRMEGEMS
ncbi:MAG: sigma-70 family RNA polymerase sigma factor [Verrucomicrobiota bacterium]